MKAIKQELIQGSTQGIPHLTNSASVLYCHMTNQAVSTPEVHHTQLSGTRATSLVGAIVLVAERKGRRKSTLIKIQEITSKCTFKTYFQKNILKLFITYNFINLICPASLI